MPPLVIAIVPMSHTHTREDGWSGWLHTELGRAGVGHGRGGLTTGMAGAPVAQRRHIAHGGSSGACTGHLSRRAGAPFPCVELLTL